MAEGAAIEASVQQASRRVMITNVISAGGGGGTGGTTSGSGSGTSAGRLPPNGGETLGIPYWMRFPQGNIWGALLPIDPSCEFGPCVPVGKGVLPGAIAIGACISNPACVTAVTTLITATVMYLPKIVHAVKDVTKAVEDSEAKRCQKVHEKCQEQCWDEIPKGRGYGGSETPGLLRRCVRKCMALQGCLDF